MLQFTSVCLPVIIGLVTAVLACDNRSHVPRLMTAVNSAVKVKPTSILLLPPPPSFPPAVNRLSGGKEARFASPVMFAIYITAGLSGTALQSSARSHPATQVHSFFPPAAAAAAGSCERASLSHAALYMKERRLSFIRRFFIYPLFTLNPWRQDKKNSDFFSSSSRLPNVPLCILCSYFTCFCN